MKPSRNRPLVVVGITLGLLFAYGTAVASHEGAHHWAQTDKLWNPTEGQFFGDPLAADETTLVADSSEGVHIYELAPTKEWELVQTIHQPANPFAENGVWGETDGRDFGHSLALDTDAGVLAIGDPELDVTGNLTHYETDAGALYIYEQAANGTWEQTARFVGPINSDFGEINGPFFGDSVAIHDDTVVAGARSANVDGEYLRGLAKIFERQPNGTWTQTARLTSPSPWAAEWDEFGEALAVTDDRVAIAAPGEATSTTQNAGAVHIYEPAADGWQHTQRLTPPMVRAAGLHADPPMLAPNTAETRMEAFGSSLAFDADGSTLVAGAYGSTRLAGVSPPTSTDLGPGDQVLTKPWGTVYVFEQAGHAYTYSASLENPDREAYSGFGLAVGIDRAGTTLIVGASLHGNQSEQAPNTASDQQPALPSWVSDHGVATHGEGSATGTAYIFERTSPSLPLKDDWACTAELSGDDTDNQGPPWGDDFGDSVAVTDSAAIVGAEWNGPSHEGSVYEFHPETPMEPRIAKDPTGLTSPCGVQVQAIP